MKETKPTRTRWRRWRWAVLAVAGLLWLSALAVLGWLQLHQPPPILRLVEQEVGRQYIDEDLNAKENPYGLSEFDLEELDELMNTESE